MADSSSDSDHIRRRTGRRGPVRATRIHNHGAEDVTEKIHTLASTLQDTNRNLRHVDQMLGQYREYNNEQAEAIANLKETLEQSIGQLRSQRRLRSSGVRSASLSSLYASDLDGGAPEGHHFQPTSPLKDYGETVGARHRRSRSAVRFVDQGANLGQLHSLHQSLRDLSSEQIRLEDDLSRELSRRNRTDAETKRRLEDLTNRLNESQRQETVSERVERRLEEIEREIRSERQLVERRQDQLGHMSVHLQEALKQQDANANEVEIVLKNKILKMEGEKSKLAQDLECSRRKLDQSENSREALLHQIEDLRSQLLRAEEERQNLQHHISQIAIHHQSHTDEQEDDRRKRRDCVMCVPVLDRSDPEKQEMEKQIWELKAKLNHSAVMSEIEELKRCIEHKDKERAQLGMQIEVLTSDLEMRETQQQRMLNQLKEIQSNYKVCENECRAAELRVTELAQQLENSTKEAESYLAEFRQSEVLRLENEKKKEELKLKAQESIRHWKLKCRKLEHEIEKQTELQNQLMEKNNLLLKEKDDLKSQLLSAMHQMENLQKELTDVLEKRAKQEEELHCREMKLNETRSLQMALEQEIRAVRETVDKLESELQKQSLIQSQIRTDKQRLEEELTTSNMIHEKDQARLLEMQSVIKNLSAARAELTNQLAEEEKSKKEMHKTLTKLQKEQESSQEEMATTSKQLKLERDVHQQELAELQSELQRVRAKHDQRVQEMMKLFSQEKEEATEHIAMLKAELVEERNLMKAHRRQVEKMKIECDKLTEELTHKEEEYVKYRRKYQLMKQELDEKNKRISSEDDHLRRIEEVRLQLHDQLQCLQNEQESILSMIGNEIDAACEVLSRDSVEKFTPISVTPGIQNDPHRWLAETKTKLRWLSEEVKERGAKEKKLRHHLLQSREQLKQLTLSKENEHQNLMDRIEKLEQHLDDVYQEKKDLLEKTLRKEEEIGALQERITALETSTRVALEHLESVPEKLNLLEDFRDFGDSYKRTEVMEERSSKYKEILGSLQQHLEDSKRRLEDFRDKKTGADISAIQSASSNWRSNTSFMSSSLLSNSGSLTKSTSHLDLNATRKGAISMTINGMKLQTEDKY
ncbi:centrosomal protein of 128 kDa isoform X2 [Varanus komodoensis]|uniref:centrosomal protein of 128 kDa isoform X2 n=1 Tax=Varanus komodoensis TaxID=61221 RepID=UPI001CF78FA1|nr:centrosomal protein of 128 kDa isoform X2 [Varanus komodoensis]